ncbi:hypothetical protein L3X38_024830 [Prunus dulcis]|uniref:Uncharacterized protein n=1 Tax=Prunus dulcis TaxID=3755 RepID=A0AAD4W391_PRUDU|nr:hypothetical protein L3X38_024830 [Prunus dulcis]
MGDFNDILYSLEKQEGNIRTEWSMHDFHSFVADSQLLDLGFVGYPFTLHNRRHEGYIQERLDRGLGYALWLHHYPEAIVSQQVVEGSDHFMLILRTYAVKKRRKSRYIYDPRWGAQGCGCASVGKGSTREWRNSQVRIDALRTDLRAEYQKTSFDSSIIKEMEFKLQSAIQEEEMYWKLKSRVQWLKERDKNTKFFHTKTIAHRRQNLMKGLEDSNRQWRDDAEDMKRIASEYLSKNFTTDRPTQIEEVTQCVTRKVQPQQNASLIKPVSTTEIVDAFKALHQTKSPGPNGFTGSFYHHHWEIIGTDVITVVKSFFELGACQKK